ncbi:hypothetical protein N7448_006076 [Penicillium atrosanguineum]|uniref:FAR1 domain-containing protein n=1 Tax=Penicillium atrosanguineum TaxID=1132637 RepID=A0A9W9GXY6_9EURO|nr:uncharacterized protein N7443_009837 [Penicillium atrosanguineum]KAJ5131918.1 hypothetical protein N7448_006076 [Penicillium atrosanguineum]KAJ5137872.1 hypothetical protein N7526_004105 [Penicillium atrosanguineum]KAJ5289584.1 hypothetical protein N7443_009837 [Penicillium atrosanguineum]KAJ5307403.1 hypothetical protein N7476_008059 [Penicillium atrosanguineum]
MESSAEELFDSRLFLLQSPPEQVRDIGENHVEQPAQPALEPKEYFPGPPAEGVFESKGHLLDYLRNHALRQGYAIIIQKSRANRSLYIGCDRGGVPKDKIGASPEVRRRHKVSRKCGCSFQMYGKWTTKTTTWELKIKTPIHNHPADENMIAHPSARRLTAEQQRHIKHLNVIGVKPRDIMTFLKLENPSALLIPRDIYNELARLKREPEPTAHEQTAPQRVVSQQSWPLVPMRQQAMPRDSMLRGSTPQESTLRETTPQPTRPLVLYI